jgi:sRNA-binding regulator protein Hfq
VHRHVIDKHAIHTSVASSNVSMSCFSSACE